MSFPVVLTGFRAGSVGAGNPSCIVAGPFKSSAKSVYLFGPATADDHTITALKSTDTGRQTWNAVGTDFSTSSNRTLWYMRGFQVGDVVHLVSQSAPDVTGTANVDVRYHTFNMATDTWTITNEVIESNLTVQSGGTAFLRVFCDIAVRSDGDVIVLYQGTAASSRARLKYARRESAVWTTNIAVGTGTAGHDDQGIGIAVGDSDRFHFFWVDFTSATNFIAHRSLTSDNTLNTINTGQSHADAETFNHSHGIGACIAYSNGGVTKVACICGGDTTIFPVAQSRFNDATNPTLTNSTWGANGQYQTAFFGGFGDNENLYWIATNDLANGGPLLSKSSDAGANYDSPVDMLDIDPSQVSNAQTKSSGGRTVFSSYAFGTNKMVVAGVYTDDQADTVNYFEYGIRDLPEDRYSQAHFRFRTDAGAVDATPTWGAAEDASYNPGSDVFRVRIGISSVGDDDSGAYSIYASKNGDADTLVTSSSTKVKAVAVGPSSDDSNILVPRLTQPL